MNLPGPDEAFTIARHGDVHVVVVAGLLQHLDTTLVEGAAAVLLEPLRGLDAPLVVVDLSQLPAFGTAFLALLIRCWKAIAHAGGTMVISGASPDVLALFKITKFDTIWPIYQTAEEARQALQSD